MTDAEAVDRAVELTGVGRYRHLASAANTLPAPDAPADWVRFCREIAARGGSPPAPIAVDYGIPAGPGVPCCGG